MFSKYTRQKDIKAEVETGFGTEALVIWHRKMALLYKMETNMLVPIIFIAFL